MATYLDKSRWEEQILIPDERTPILGGQPEWDSTNMLSGWSNVPAGMLADRTRFLHDRIQEIEQDIEQGAAGSLKRDNNLSDLQDVGQAKFNLGLNLVDNVRDADKPVSTATQTALNTKVDKVAGKGLSDQNYTLAEKNKLGGIQAGAQVNSVTSVAGKTGVVTLNKTDVGLSNVDNTSDSSKPVSTPQQTALNLKLNANANAVSASKLVTPRTISLSGDASGSVSFDGSDNAAIVVEVVDDSHNHVISNVDGLQTALNNKVDRVTGMGLSQENFTTSEKSKLAGLESSKFKGEFTSLTALQSAFPTAPVGSYAYVDQGVGQDVVKYIWDTTDTRWVLQQGESATLTPADVKSLYEANANTNAFTDTEKTKLSGIQAGAQVNSITSVAGRTGAVTLAKTDVGLGNVDNTGDSVKNVASAAKLTTTRSISATGDATWSVNFDGTGNTSAALTLSSSGVTAGTYPKVTVDAKGRVTSGSAMIASDVPALNATKAQVLSGTNNVYVSGGSYLNVISWNNIGSISTSTSISLATSLNHRLTATASLTLDAINADQGKTGDIIISTPTAVTISWSGKWKFLGTVPNIGGAGETWVVSYKVFDASNIYASAAKVA